MTTTQTFTADLDRMNTALTALVAVIDFGDGNFGIDSTKAPASMVGTYSRLLSYGYANGLI